MTDILRRLRNDIQTMPRLVQFSLVGVGLALLFYSLDFKLLLLPALLLLNVLFLPLPQVFASIFSRIIISLLVLLALIPVAGAIQFLIAPGSQFGLLAVILVVINLAILWYAPTPKQVQRPWLDGRDLGALLIVGVFLAPFVGLFLMDNSLARILEIIGAQVVDGGNHYSGIIGMQATQSLPMGYYPLGYHFGIAFLQDSFLGPLYNLGWQNNLILYISHYMLTGSFFAYIVYYFCISLFDLYKERLAPIVSKAQHILLAACLGPSFIVFYLLSFFAQGFLNFYYLCAIVILCFMYVHWTEIVHANNKWRFGMLMYFVLAYAAVSSWSVLIPPLMLVGLFFLLPAPLTKQSLKLVFSKENIPIFLAILLQLVFFYYQFFTVDIDGAEGVNATGNLKHWHYLLLAAGTAILLWWLLHKTIKDSAKHYIFGIFVPLLAYVGLLALMQYYTTGEVRYYVIKTSLIIEILFLCLAVTLLVGGYLQQQKDWRHLVLLPIFPLLGMILLLSTVPGPIRDLRDISKSISGLPKPPFYADDARHMVKLGTEGKIRGFNMISLHINERGNLTGSTQMAFRANLLQHIDTTDGHKVRNCNDKIYSILQYGEDSLAEQQKVIALLRECAALLRDLDDTYHIVTDAKTAPFLKEIFGNMIVTVY